MRGFVYWKKYFITLLSLEVILRYTQEELEAL